MTVLAKNSKWDYLKIINLDIFVYKSLRFSVPISVPKQNTKIAN